MKQNLTKIKLVVAIVASTLMLSACNSNYEKTASGMAYKISRGKSKDSIKQGNIVKFYIEYKLQDKDSVLNSNYGKMPGYLPVDTAKLPKHNFTEIITKLHAGDKVDFVLNIDTLKSLGQIPGYDNVFKKGGLIKGKVEILKVFANDSLTQPDYQAEAKKEEARQNLAMQKEQKERDAKNKTLIVEQTKELKEYALKNNIKYVQSPLGVLVEVQNPGTGMKADSGKHAMLMYKGYLTNGTVFDANMGPTAQHKDPIDVFVGSHNTIPGFEDAMQYFGKGGKGRLLIPSVLAYGDRSAPGLPANSNLIFDIEVTDVFVEKPTTVDSSKLKK
ncbi:MAG: FKBP-type peptidyl-prolyl cis-trans isomerase [Chitinophagaceae bacterium]|nr:FKBP-type peptidyl-prolyl cis-trans isomerase [Chitinophagaceae bacterium]